MQTKRTITPQKRASIDMANRQLYRRRRVELYEALLESDDPNSRDMIEALAEELDLENPFASKTPPKAPKKRRGPSSAKTKTKDDD